MKVNRVNLTSCNDVLEPIVVIDVLRAFTTASFIFAAGVTEIILVSSVEEAFNLKKKEPSLLLTGEFETLPIKGFDFGNSPTEFLNLDLHGRRVVQRTTCGTQGVILAAKASNILLSSLCCASATAKYINQCGWNSITMNETGLRPGDLGDEDRACADLIEAILMHKIIDRDEIKRRVKESKTGKMFDGSRLDLPIQDIDLATSIDIFNFAMVVKKSGNHFIATPQYLFA